jgi:hypothetical protein
MPDDAFDAENFPEYLYLMAFGDVRQAVMSGEFASGYAHYLAFGREEISTGRRTSPFEGGPPGLSRSVLPPPETGTPVRISTSP